MSSATDLLGYLTYPVTIALFMSQIPTLRTMAFSGSARGFSIAPTVLTFGNCFMWASYGVNTGGGSSVMGVNIAGAVLQLLYASVFYSWSDSAARRTLMFAMGGLVTGVSALVAAVTVLQPQAGRTILAGVAISFNVAMFGSPLSSVWASIKSQDTSRVPLPLTVASTLCSGLWLTYGYLLGDWFIAGPNAAGLVLCLIQLSAVAAVNMSKKRTVTASGAMKRNASTSAFLSQAGEWEGEGESSKAKAPAPAGSARPSLRSSPSLLSVTMSDEASSVDGLGAIACSPSF